MRKSLQVLHLASFNGNIGDVANHAGARALFSQHLDFDLDVTELEIREFYWGLRAFDVDFIRYANRFDFLLIGGGNYFELWVDKSATGTSIDIPAEHLNALTVPTAFYALGVDTGQGCSSVAALRFRAFMDTVLSRKDMFVCVRNDGSSTALSEILGPSYSIVVPVMPDGGFFAGATLVEPSLASRNERKLIGINLAGDMLDRRFNADLSSEAFLSEFSSACTRLLVENPFIDLEFVPHIWRDIQVISEILPFFPDALLRSRIRVAPLHASPCGLQEFLTTYQKFSLVLGTRFHANVCPIGMGVPTRGLLNYPQVSHLYRELGLTERLVEVRYAGFGEMLFTQAIDDLSEYEVISESYKVCSRQLRVSAVEVLNKMNTWLHNVLA